MRNKIGATSNAYRVYRNLQLLICSLLVCGCGYLILFLRAVPAREMWAVLVALLYTTCLSATSCTRFVSPCQSPPANSMDIKPVPLSGSGNLRVQTLILVSVSAVLSLVLPWTLILLGKPSQLQTNMLSPHLFIMMSQVIFEIRCNRAKCNYVVRLLIPIAATAYRLRLLLDWCHLARESLQSADDISSRKFFMCGLAYANLTFWVFTLFFFLLARIVPRYFSELPASSTKSQRLTM